MSRVLFILPLVIYLIWSCGAKETVKQSNDLSVVVNEELDVNAYSEKLKSMQMPQLVDVRTAEEFAEGHLLGALNFDINSGNFETSLTKLDKTKPVFVYCLSGGRSSSAAGILEEKGFTEIYNMSGGILKWDAAGLPLTDVASETEGMSKEEFMKILNSDKEYVLVDFNAKWCKPCKVMGPWLEEVAERNASQLVLVKIDADANKELLKELGVSSLPVLQLYQKSKKTWEHQGEITEADFLKSTRLK